MVFYTQILNETPQKSWGRFVQQNESQFFGTCDESSAGNSDSNNPYYSRKSLFNLLYTTYQKFYMSTSGYDEIFQFSSDVAHRRPQSIMSEIAINNQIIENFIIFYQEIFE